MADPGAGNIRVNNTAMPSATLMAMSSESNEGTDHAPIIKSLRPGDQILIQDQNNSANWIRYEITSAVVDNTTWFQIGIAVVTSSGTTSSNNNVLVVTFEAVNIDVTSVFGRVGAVVAAIGDYTVALITGNWPPARGGVPAGGAAGQSLVKNTPADFDTAWATGGADLVYNGDFPAGGPTYTDGDVVIRNGVAYMCVRPTNVAPAVWPGGVSGGSGLPIGGTAGQRLTKNGPTDYDASWVTPVAQLPAGGTAAQILKKNTATDYDAGWQTLNTNSSGTGGAVGAAITNTSPLHMGYGIRFTPVTTGKVLVIFTGSHSNTTVATYMQVIIRFGIGASPARGAALAGNQSGQYATASVNGTGNGGYATLACSTVITGLAIGTDYWFDVQAMVSGGSGTLFGPMFSILEFN
jgi:hypothetical protein